MIEHPDHGIGLQDNTELLHRISARPADRFAGVFAAETVERYVFESNDRLTALAKSKGAVASEIPEVSFVCVQNAGRSQMAAALVTVEAKGRIHVRHNRVKALAASLLHEPSSEKEESNA